MKKFLFIILASLLTLSLAACGGEEKPSNPGVANNQNSVKSAVELLTKVWNSYKDDEKFPAAGGDMSEENMTMDAPGKFGLDDATSLDSTLGFSAVSVSKIDDAASLIHMMNANTFTCGAFHVKDAGDIVKLSSLIKDNIMNRQWICGFPDKLVIVNIDGYIVSFFGEKEIVDNFKTKLTAVYPAAEIVCDEPIM